MSRRKRDNDARAERVRKKRRRGRKRMIVLILEVIILMLLSGVAYAMTKYDKIQTVEIDSDEIVINDGMEKEGYTTLALFGGDSRDGELEAGTHADTIILASINNKTKEIRMISVYRDTLLKQADDTYKKANNAYFCGGPKEAINMLNRNLDLDVTDYATVDFSALVDTIDLLGGIDIDIQEEEIQYINKFMDETARVAGTDVNYIDHAGLQHLDGTQATTYARIRSTAGGDFTRTERQRLVIEKIFDKAVSTNLTTINKIIDEVFPKISTSLSLKEILSLASGAAQYKLGDSDGFPFDTAFTSYNNAGSVVVAVGLAENVEQLHKFLYPEEEYTSVSATVQTISDEIANLTGIVRTEDYVSGSETDSSEDSNTLEETSSSDVPVITDVSE